MILLYPRVGLHLCVYVDTDTKNINHIDMIYANSEIVSLDDPRKDLPDEIHWHRWLLVFICALFLCFIWMYAACHCKYIYLYQRAVRYVLYVIMFLLILIVITLTPISLLRILHVWLS